MQELHNPQNGVHDPIQRFSKAFERAASTLTPINWGAFDVSAAAFATADEHGQPSIRYVLIKEFDHTGFYIYTNYESKKGHDLAFNPKGALCFYWPWIGEQIRIEGSVARASVERSDAYFQGRPKGSQLGAWASRQSRPLVNRVALEADIAALADRFGDQPINRPPHWGGYILTPQRMEFWKEGEYRLHHRELFIREENQWRSMELYP